MKTRTVLITGASGGIGQAIAKRFALDGYQTILHYNKNPESVESLKHALEKLGCSNVLTLGGDLTDPKELDAMVAFISAQNITVDVLINNAGIKAEAPIDLMSDAVFASVMRTNVNGAFMITKRLVPAMKKQKYGRIINITSGIAKDGMANQVNYGASKAALENMTKSLAQELGPYGITVNSVAPGLIETNMTRDISREIKDAYIKKIPIKRLVEAKDVAQACAFFADERSGAISSQMIGVNGGLR